MQERIHMLRREIQRLRQLAKGCDGDIAAQMAALASEMEQTANEMQERLNAQAPSSAGSTTDAAQAK